MARHLSELTDEFDEADISALQAAPDVPSDDAEKAYDYTREKQKAKIERLHADNDMRTQFFGWASKLAAWMIGGNFAIFAAYLTVRAVDLPIVPDAVMLAWVSATVVEIIGVVAIIARHLFPGRRRDKAPSS